MSERLYVKNPLFPMAGIAVSVFTFAFGLAMAKSPGVFSFSAGYGCCWRCSGISAPALRCCLPRRFCAAFSAP